MKNSNISDIHIPDPRLAILIRGAAGLDTDEPIAAESLTSVEKLTAVYFYVRDLTGIENLTELKMLHLYSNNEIEDIRPLANLNKLTHLNLRDNKIKDITPLSGLTQLQTLFLNINEISDIMPLAKLVKLHSLYLDNNNISDISVIENFPRLTKLSIKGNPIQDRTPIHKLRQQNPDLKLDIDL